MARPVVRTSPSAEHSGNAAGRRDEVLGLLRKAEDGLEITDVARQLGIHPNTARFHLLELVRRGQAEVEASAHGGPGRPAQVFRVAPGMDPNGPRDFRTLAEALIDSLTAGPDPRRRAVAAGQAWGRRHARSMTTRPARSSKASLTRLTGALGDLGFAPEASPGSGIALRSCPFLELALDRGEVVCSVHLGLMRGLLESWEAPITVDRLDAFAKPDTCLVHLGFPAGQRPDASEAS